MSTKLKFSLFTFATLVTGYGCLLKLLRGLVNTTSKGLIKSITGSVGDPEPDPHLFGSGSFPFLKKVLTGLHP